MNLIEIIKVSLSALRTNKIRSLLTMLGIVIGVASVILLVSIVLGLGKTIRDELNSFGANLLVVFPGEPGGGRGPGGVVANRLDFKHSGLIARNVSEVKEVITSVQGVGTVKYSNKVINGTTIFAITGNYFNSLNIDVIEGRGFSEKENGSVVVIGSTVKEELFPFSNPIGKQVVIKGRRFKVLGIQEKRGSIFGIDQDNTVLLPLLTGSLLMGIDRPNSFFIKVMEDKDIKLVQKKVENVLLKELADEDFSVSTQEDTLNLVGRILNVLSFGLGAVAAISLVVGGVGIMNI
ncbi:ABC transporter permease, partial [candidate division WWE3 bacterium]|nr:ABC transporter permease [candidate division WWE3 bacterium]